MKKRLLLQMVIFGLGLGGGYMIGKYERQNLDASSYFKVPVTLTTDGRDGFINYVDFDGSDFSPRKINIRRGDYLAVTNKSNQDLMWLVSTSSGLMTVRGYAFGERLQVSFSDSGTFLTANKKDLTKTLEVVVE